MRIIIKVSIGGMGSQSYGGPTTQAYDITGPFDGSNADNAADNLMDMIRGFIADDPGGVFGDDDELIVEEVDYDKETED